MEKAAMRKIKYVLGRPCKELRKQKRKQKHEEQNYDYYGTVDNYENDADFFNNMYGNQMFSDDLYSDEEAPDTEDEAYYNFDIEPSHYIDKEEALTSIENRLPAIVLKTDKNNSTITDDDYVFKLLPKMKSRWNEVKRVGYLRVSKRYKPLNINMDKDAVGVIGMDYPILKKKGFNMEKLGYLKINNKQADEFIEVVISRGYRRFIFLAIIIALLSLLPHMMPENINLNNFNIYQLITEMEYSIHDVEIKHISEATPTQPNNEINLKLKIESSEDYRYKIIIKQTNPDSTILYESPMIPTAGSIDTIELDKLPDTKGIHECKIICEVYGASKLGEITSQFKLITK